MPRVRRAVAVLRGAWSGRRAHGIDCAVPHIRTTWHKDEEENVHNPKRRSLSVLVVLSMSIALLLPAGTLAKGKPQLPNYSPVAPSSWVTNPTPDLSRLNSSGAAAAASAATNANDGSADYETGDTVVGINLDNSGGFYFLTTYQVRAIGEHIEVWVQSNTDFPAGDPRNPVVVTDEQIAYLVNEFDTNIYPKESEFWREPALRDGTNALLPYDYVSFDGKDRVIAMISNVRDDQYYDPTFPVYIAGFFSSTINAYMDRNVITIDAYDWANRVGPNSSPWRDGDPSNDRPHLYEGTFAHEYQHLLHADQNPGEENWVNEGLSDWTEWLVGYGIPDGHWDTAQEYAENSLVIWGDQGQGTEILADYGEAFMFMHYLYGKYGETAMQALFQDQGFGIAGFNDALANIGANDSFADMYHDFAIARLVLANKGNYRLGDIPSPVILNEEAYSTPGAPPWGSDYLSIANPKKVKSILFDGVDVLTRNTAWTSVEDPLDAANTALWSGTGDEIDRFAIFETTGGGTLTFDTLYDIEEQWDFGFVQVSTDGGATWTTLTNADTRSDIVAEGYPAIKNVLNAGGEGFTGYSGGWVNESFDLSAYSGDILVAFRFMTDWGTNGNLELDDPNWYVDNVAVDGNPISDGSNASEFKDVTYYLPIDLDFNVDLVSLPRIGSIGNASTKVLHLMTDDATEMASAAQIKQAMRASGALVLIVTYDAPQGVADYAPYDVQIIY
jgi:immune inhibitor A